jgi:hypothetical protein
MRLIRPIAGLAALALVAAACGGGGDDTAESTTTTIAATTTTESTTTTTTTTTTLPETTTTTTVPVTIRQPLTGEPLASEADGLLRPALVAKIDNNRRAVPNHSGLGVADMVFEEVVEGRTTRFAAVFHSRSSDPIGPLRSGRTQDINLFTSFNQPLFVWSGGNAAVTQAINDSTLVNLGPNNATGYFRGAGSAPHNLYNTTDRIWFQLPAGHPGPPPPQLQFRDADVPFGGQPTSGTRVRVGGENIEWTWNAGLAKFDRSQRGQPHNDSLTGRISASNVIVLGVQYLPSPADRNSPEAQTVGEGPAFFFSGGEFVQGTWKRDDPFFPIQYLGPNLEEIRFAPGNTWIELADVGDVLAGGVEVLP